MKESTRKKWMPMAVVFLSVFGSFAALMYLSISTFSVGRGQSPSPFFRFQQNPESITRSQDDIRRIIKSVSPGWSKMTVYKGQETTVGKVIITYRGLEAYSRFRLDALIPDLDSQYVYKQTFSVDQARKGFSVGGQRFELISAGTYRMRLRHYTPAR